MSKVNELCVCVSLTCRCENAGIGNMEHWVCEESWPIKYLQPINPSPQDWASGALINCSIYLYVCACMPFSTPLRLAVCVSLYSLYMNIKNASHTSSSERETVKEMRKKETVCITHT